jgi:CheY-like chemotaxis protein
MAKFRILFVDDDPEMHKLYLPRFAAAGYEVRGCLTPREAKDVITRELKSFDLAVVDVRLVNVPGDASGVHIAKAINGVIPVIMLTGGTDVQHLLQPLNEGYAVTAVFKSGDPDELLDVIRKRLVHRVFVAHGHDATLKADVVFCLKALGLEPLLIADGPGQSRTIPELIDDNSNVSFAVVLLTPDDVGRKVDANDLRPRARQNVILEWGFFTGLLGRKRVAALQKGEPELDLPSNYDALRCISIDAAGQWRHKLATELSEAGLPIDASKLQP